MTATLVTLLANDGLLRWNATLEEALSDAPIELHPSVRAITLKDLTAHRSGLTLPYKRRPWFAYSFWDVNLSPEDGRTRAVHDVLSKPATFERGTFYYEGINQIIIAYMIDRLGHGSYEKLIEERLFKPLGMLDTGFGPRGGDTRDSFDIPPPHIPNPVPGWSAIPVSWLPSRFHSMPPATNPGGNVRCTLRDYDKFLWLYADGGAGDVRLGLTQEDFSFLHKLWDEDDDKHRYTPGGWFRGMADDHGDQEYSLCHSGANLFYNSHARIDVGKGRGDCYVAATSCMIAQRTCVEAVEGMRLGKLSLE